MDASTVNSAIVTAIGDSAIPGVDEQRLVDEYGPEEGSQLASLVRDLVQEAVGMPIVWGDKSLKDGVLEILTSFKKLHPELSSEALHEIGRCVGWNWR